MTPPKTVRNFLVRRLRSQGVTYPKICRIIEKYGYGKLGVTVAWNIVYRNKYYSQIEHRLVDQTR